ncbi:MAG TPA: DUF559 domain-containing protein [Terriglobales bacterium]|nr:DUF559 domain-containing protein [Terriglobales bacterium]
MQRIRWRNSSRTLVRAKQLRTELTYCERILWYHLRVGRLLGYHFRRQQPIGPFIADFACCDRRVIVELDGDGHDGRNGYDERRTAALAARGYRVLRFTNDQVRHHTWEVLAAIVAALEAPL